LELFWRPPLTQKDVLILLSTIASTVSEIRLWCLSLQIIMFPGFALMWASGLVFDTFVFTLTVWHSLSSRPHSKGIPTPLFRLLLRDGVIYFVVMFTAKVVNFVVFWTLSRDLITINWTFNHTITVIMISRLFLNLRALPDSVLDSGLSSKATTSIAFAAIDDVDLHAAPCYECPESRLSVNQQGWLWRSVVAQLASPLDDVEDVIKNFPPSSEKTSELQLEIYGFGAGKSFKDKMYAVSP